MAQHDNGVSRSPLYGRHPIVGSGLWVRGWDLTRAETCLLIMYVSWPCSRFDDAAMLILSSSAP